MPVLQKWHQRWKAPVRALQKCKTSASNIWHKSYVKLYNPEMKVERLKEIDNFIYWTCRVEG